MVEDAQSLKNFINNFKSHINSIASRQEHLIELSIGMYYSVNDLDYRDFAHVFFHNENELSFNKKIKLFERFLKRKFPQILKNNPDFLKQIHRVRKLRNKFAHSINLSIEELKQFVGKSYFELVFIEEGEMKREQFTLEDMTKRVDDLEKIGDVAEKIFQKIFKNSRAVDNEQ